MKHFGTIAVSVSAAVYLTGCKKDDKDPDDEGANQTKINFSEEDFKTFANDTTAFCNMTTWDGANPFICAGGKYSGTEDIEHSGRTFFNLTS